MAKKLLNPRGYLSPTQVELWLRDPDKYIQQYVYGAQGYVNNRMTYGKKVAEAEETGEQTDDEMINMLVALLPKYPGREITLRTAFKTQYGEVELLGKLDKFHPDTLAFRDTKTGTTKWTQGRADKHRQLIHYAAIIWLKHKKLPGSIHIDWGETEILEDGSVTLTGNVKTFEVKVSVSDILQYLALVARVAKEIDERYRAEIKSAL